MIREEDLREAIAECEGSKHPTASTCLKLAAYYAILNQKFQKSSGKVPINDYSFSSAPEIAFSNSEFSQIVKEKGINECFSVIDEAMSAVLMVNPKLYNSIIRKLMDI